MFYLWRCAGRLEEGAAAFRKALELNAQFPAPHNYLGRILREESRLPEALTEIDKEQDPFWRTDGLALAYYAAGRIAESDRELATCIDRYAIDSAFQIAEIYAYRGETDRAFEWLERAYRQRDGGLTEFKGDPLLHKLEKVPRYADFTKKMMLPL